MFQIIEVEKIQELKEQGKTQREIAEEIGVDHKAVSYHLGKTEVLPISPNPETEPPNVISSPKNYIYFPVFCLLNIVR